MKSKYIFMLNVLCVNFYSILGSKTEQLKIIIWNQRLRVVKTRTSDLIWTVASLAIAMHYQLTPAYACKQLALGQRLYLSFLINSVLILLCSE